MATTLERAPETVHNELTAELVGLGAAAVPSRR
jgi:hypothetical protein